VRHAKKAHKVLSALNSVKQALLRATTGQCGMDSAFCTMDTVKDVARLDRPGKRNHGEDSREVTILCAATVHRFGLHVDFARQNADTLPEMCSCCKAPLWDSAIPGSRLNIFLLGSATWVDAVGTGGDNKLMKQLKGLRKIWSFLMRTREERLSPARGHLGSWEGRPQNEHCNGPRNCLWSNEIVLILILQKLRFRPQGRGTSQFWEGREIGQPDRLIFHDAVCSIGCKLFGTTGSSFPSNAQGVCLHPGHEAGELFSSQGSIRIDPCGSLTEDLKGMGARITWTAQREHAGQILRGMQAFHDGVAFTMRWGELGENGNGG